MRFFLCFWVVGILGSTGWAAALPVQPAQISGAALASLHGEVLDREGAVCEGAQVALHAGGGAVRTVVSDDEGQFSFTQVPAGDFEITVTAIGFATETLRGTVAGGATLTLADVVLTPTSASEVTVSASPMEVATEELHAAEQQRVLGIVPNFTVIYDHSAPPLSSRQKYQLATRILIDPYTVLMDGASAGLQQADEEYQAYGNGAAGYMRRFGAAYGNDVIGTMLGVGVLPSMLHQDPRYFWKGTGTARSRVFYAIAASVICKSDSGHWQPNYSSLLADFSAAGITNAYYPASDKHSGTMIVENVGLSKVTDAVENIFQEFVARHFTRKAPSYADAR